ncbi:hypothetical protein IJM86_02455 [bacterium]|nr:hypothetical protein [bacterium]
MATDFFVKYGNNDTTLSLFSRNIILLFSKYTPPHEGNTTDQFIKKW